MQRISRAFRIWRIDIEIARRGTSSRRREPALAELLPAAGVVELDHEVRLLGLEVGRRVVEGEVAVLADAHEGHVDRGAGRGARPRAGTRRPGPARRRPGSGRPAGGPARRSARAGSGGSWRGGCRARPTYSSRWNISTRAQSTPGRRGERVEELELRGAGGGDHARLPAARDRLADRRRGPLGRRAARAPASCRRSRCPSVTSCLRRQRRLRARPTSSFSHSFAISRWYGSVMWMPSRQRKRLAVRGGGQERAHLDHGHARLARRPRAPGRAARRPCPRGRARRRR